MEDFRSNGSRVRLPDGRWLGYAEFGDPGGLPLIFLHGWPGTRLEAALLNKSALRHAFHVIAVDRPGVGLSDFRPDLTLLTFAEDAAAFADILGISKFALLGVSGGGPFAAACASAIPERLFACALVSTIAPPGTDTTGMKPSNRVVQFISRRTPWLLPFLVWLSLGRSAKDAERTREGMRRGRPQLSEPDQELLSRPDIEDLFVQDTMEAFRGGSRGVVLEGRLLGSDWGFSLEQVNRTRVLVWHGEWDQNSPVAHGRAVATRIPGCRMETYPEEGHLSTLFNHSDQILRELKDAALEP